MKTLLAIVMATGTCCMLPATSSASDIVRDRAAEAQQVTDALGLGSDSVRVLSVTEAEAVRGTGGSLHLPSIKLPSIKLNANVNVKANVAVKANVLGIVKVDAKVKAGVRIH